jgi:Ca-activated chloride channel family protein
MIQDFHFLRPWWLAMLLPAIALWWTLRRGQDDLRGWRGVIAPHLLPYLVSQRPARQRFGPAELLGLGWLVAVMAIAGPAWRREPAPFADDVAALSIVVKVTASMTTEDVPPNRLARGIEKLQDLLALRRGAKTSLVAYAGTAHIVMPTTTDSGVIGIFAQALNPKIMPRDGDAVAEAFGLADQTLAESGGSILWITDGAASGAPGLATWRAKSTTPVRVLATLPDGVELSSLSEQAERIGATLVRLTADDADVQQLARAARFVPASAGQQSDRWQESGYWLTPLVALITLVFFRRGWMLSAGS